MSSELKVARYCVEATEVQFSTLSGEQRFYVEHSVILTNLPTLSDSCRQLCECLILDLTSIETFTPLKVDSLERQLLDPVDSLDWQPRHVRLVLSFSENSSPDCGLSRSAMLASDSLFVICKALSHMPHQLDSVAFLILNGFDGATPLPISALFAGFVQGLAAELPICDISGLVTSSSRDDDRGLQLSSYGLSGSHARPTVYYANGDSTWTYTAVRSLGYNRANESESISTIVAAGGARGITFPILSELAKRYRPRIWLMGSQDLSKIPDWVFEASEEQFHDLRTRFIREQLQSRQVDTPAQAAYQFRRYAASRETRRNLSQLADICGASKIHYIPCDVIDPIVTGEAARLIKATTDNIDLLLFAAGIERSTVIQKKSLQEFQLVRDTKLSGYDNLKRAFSQVPTRLWCNFGSAVSLVGSRGLLDYCAANAFLAASAQHARATTSTQEWTIGWPLWSEVGMGAEHQRLAWTPISPEQGVNLFFQELLLRDHDPYVSFLGAFEQNRLSVRPESQVLGVQKVPVTA